LTKNAGRKKRYKKNSRYIVIFVLANYCTINKRVKMKEQKKNKEQAIEKIFGMKFTTNEALNKYKGPEYEAPKLKEIRKRFSKGIIIHE
jgi:hypothetical protein